MHYKSYKSLQPDMDNFLQNYRLLRFYTPPSDPIRNRKPKKERVCRFCVRKTPEVKFNSEAHIIPRLFGNNFGVSDHECDSCNNRFSRYETHLADFLGLVRTFLSVTNESSVPTFKSPGESLVARLSDAYSQSKGIVIDDHSKNGISINTETGENCITYTKNSYKPINVFKSLLKIALTLMPESYLNDYGMMFDFINSEDNHPAYVQFAQVLFYTTEFKVQTCCYLFEKTDPQGARPTHIFKLYFENFIYQFFIPYHVQDMNIYEAGASLTTKYCPPILPGAAPEREDLSFEVLDLRSTDVVKGETGRLIYRIDPKFYQDAKVYDPVTGEAFPFKPEEIVKIHFYRIENDSNIT